MRLDLSTEFGRLSQDLGALKQFARLAEAMRDHVLVPTSMEVTPSVAKASGYRPLMLTVADFEALHFLIGHICDAAQTADKRMQDLEEVACRYVEARPCA